MCNTGGPTFQPPRREIQIILESDTNHMVIRKKPPSYRVHAHLHQEPELRRKIDESVDFLSARLEQGDSFYGTTTGFGGSADTRTNKTIALQRALLQMQQCGVLMQQKNISTPNIFRTALPNGDPIASTTMPEAWTRGSMLVRCNTLARGHSAVRHNIIETFPKLLNGNMVPLVPLRGSISASGDLSPLSYIAGVLEGNPKLKLWTGTQKGEPRKLITADKALSELNIAPIVFGPKEGLGVLNGTAVSSAVAALALHETHLMAVLSQVLTAMGVEALSGTVESFNSFLAETRPHAGQIEAASNIRSFLTGSNLARPAAHIGLLSNDDTGLCQDRYALRTSSQWIGPQLEDLILAHRQVTVELNSTTDNPLVDVVGKKVHHGGNFQGVSVASAMDKARGTLQMMGKMLFAQSSELVNPTMNNGLPPNLVADEPSLSYTMKGVDINMAAYTSELGFLSHPIGPHVQSAEMSNQSINSLALLSARYTHTALDVFSHSAAAYLYMLCQALDLRVMQVKFLTDIKPRLESITEKYFAALLSPGDLKNLQKELWSHVVQTFNSSTTQDSEGRFDHIARSALPVLVSALERHSPPRWDNHSFYGLAAISKWKASVATMAAGSFANARDTMLSSPDTAAYLGTASKRMYAFVRQNLGVPLHRGLVDHPSSTEESKVNSRKELTGTQISVIYEALRSGELFIPVIECLQNLPADHPTSTAGQVAAVVREEALIAEIVSHSGA
ncbi:putative phenylalanine ammonia-lyase [Stipitochalara longipes BDJ]|nr:putative phenylalanine ammonia-lyase [Stipitochalara longipes BDJ]